MSNNNIIKTKSMTIKQPHSVKHFNMKKWAQKNWQLTVMVFLPLCFIVMFYYVPMYGLQIAFKNFRAIDGIWGSQWVGLQHFIKFFKSYQFVRVIKNTLFLSLYSLFAGFPIPILLALALNCCNSLRFKKTVQLVTYAPHFISTVVMVGMVIQVLSPKYGVVNNLIKALGGDEILFMATGPYFRSIYVWSGIWQSMGFSAIIYISALSGIDITLQKLQL